MAKAWLNSDGKKSVKPQDVPTPPGICRWLYETISPHYAKSRYPDSKYMGILDPCAGDGNLSKPWRETDSRHNRVDVWQYELTKGENFFNLKRPEDIWGVQRYRRFELVLCNPPFNQAEEFLRHILYLVGPKVPIVFFCQFGFLLNPTITIRKKETRYDWLRDKAPPITSMIPLPQDAFAGAFVHTMILFFNMPELKPVYFLPRSALRRK
jgi:hypothetical protein